MRISAPHPSPTFSRNPFPFMRSTRCATQQARWPGGKPNGAPSLLGSGRSSSPQVLLPGEEKPGLSKDSFFFLGDFVLPAQSVEFFSFLGGEPFCLALPSVRLAWETGQVPEGYTISRAVQARVLPPTR